MIKIGGIGVTCEMKDGKVELNINPTLDWMSMLFYKPLPAV